MDVPTDTSRWTLGDYRTILREVFRLNPLLRHEARKVVAQIGRPYTALFVRRGDKLVEEAEYIPISKILSWITYDESTVFFVQTDDYTVVEEMRECLPNHTIHSTVPPTKRGSYHNSTYQQTGYTPWTEKTPEQARAETTEMLVGLSVCLAAEQCWTDDTSNVGRFLKLMDDRVHVYPEDYSVDETLHVHPSWTIKHNFPVNQTNARSGYWISRPSDAWNGCTYIWRSDQEGSEVQQVGPHCVSQEVREGQEGEASGEGRVQDSQGEVRRGGEENQGVE